MIGLRIEEDCASEVRKKLRWFAMQKFRKKIEVNAPSFAERNDEGILWRLDLNWRGSALNRALSEDGCLDRTLGRLVILLQRQKQRKVGIATKRH